MAPGQLGVWFAADLHRPAPAPRHPCPFTRAGGRLQASADGKPSAKQRFSGRRLTLAGLFLPTLWGGIAGADAQLFQSILPENTVLPDGLAAYQSEPIVPVDQRAQPDTAPLGLRAGGFLINPALSETAGYDSKVIGTRTGPGSAEIVTMPSVLIASDWSQHRLAAQFGASDSRFLQLPQQSYTNYTAAVEGRYDLGRDALSLAASHLSLHLLPTDLTAGALRQPEAFAIDDVRLAYLTTLGRVTLRPQIDYSDTRYAAVAALPTPQNTLDHSSYQADLRAGYELASDRSILGDLSATEQHFPNKIASIPALNQNGWRAMIGYRDQFGPISFYGLVGFEQRYFASNAYQSHGSPVAELGFVWSPTLLTSITGRAERAIEDTSNTAASGYTSNLASLSVDHEYSRTTRLAGLLQYSRIDTLNSPEIATVYEAQASIQRSINRQLDVALRYEATAKDNSLDRQSSYVRHAVLLEATITP